LRRRLLLSAMSAATAGALLAPLQPAAAAESYTCSGDGVFHVRGHGFGHGRGMSQWGAQGAATLGKGYKTILGTYYPGTAIATVSTKANLRVRIGADTDGDLRVRPGRGLTAISPQGSRVLPATIAGAKVTMWRAILGSGTLRLQGYVGTWRTVTIGGKTALTGPLRFRADAGVVRLVLPGGNQTDYRGQLWASRDPRDTRVLRVVNLVPIESYLRSVVPGESPSWWKPAALQAQAVAARTYALWRRAHMNFGYADICDTTACQVYHGVRLVNSSGALIRAYETASTDAAIRHTAGQYLRYRSDVALTEFSAANGGHSVFGNKPYLPARADAWDGIVRNSGHAWTKSFTAARIQQRWPSVGELRSIRVLSRDGRGEWGGRVLSLQLIGTKSSLSVPGQAFASAMGLRSTWWRVA
jgi:stage II sporulation protein D